MAAFRGYLMDICDVEFKGRRKEQFQSPDHISLTEGDYVVVQAERGEHAGRITRIFESEEAKKSLPHVLRATTTADIDRMAKNGLREKEAFRLCKAEIIDRALEMKLVDVEYQLDGNKLSFYFTSDQRIDFRDLVRSLAGIYRTRIDMRQIGARDETKRACSIGSCGRPTCCGQFLDTFKTVSTESIEHQNLSVSPSKLLGVCGRLKCCLLYEEGYYEEAGKKFPVMGARIATESGPCRVIKIDIIGDAILVKYDSGVIERIPRSRLGSGGCDGKKCDNPDEMHSVDAVFQE